MTPKYKVRRVRIDGDGEIRNVGKRCQTYTDRYPLRVGGIYALSPQTGIGVSTPGLYRVEEVMER